MNELEAFPLMALVINRFRLKAKLKLSSMTKTLCFPMKLETENILQQLFIHFFCVVEHEIWVIFIIRHR